MLWKSNKQTNQPPIYSGRNTMKCLTETVAVSTAHLICLRNLGLKVTPGFRLTLHVTTRRITAVMPQLVGDGRCCAAHRLHAALREGAPRPWCSAALCLSAVQWQLTGGDGDETQERKKQLLTTRREVEGSDFWKKWGKLTGSISDLKSPKLPPFLGSNGISLKGTCKSPCRNAPASSG